MLGTLANISTAGARVIASSGGFLIEPGIGLMVWTLLVFGATMFLLSKLAFPRISEALGKRQKAIEDSIDTAERTRTEADALLVEYRERLKEARAQADEIVQRARQAAETQEQEAKARGQEIVEEAAKRAERDIAAASERALSDIRKEVADLTVMATEKVTRKVLTDSDQRRLVEEALNDLDFSGISSAARAS
jgi:F-type H+-transporting ATPase subunit b